MSYSQTQMQLTHVLQMVLRNLKDNSGLPIAFVSTVTDNASTTTTIIDSSIATRLGEANEDDYGVGGTIIIVRDAGGAAAAPEGEFSVVTAYDATTQKITFAPALSAAPQLGDQYLFASSEFPLYDMIQQINDALLYLGDFRYTNISLTTVSQQTEYALPVALKRSQIANVWIQTRLGAALDNQAKPLTNYDVNPALPGSTSTLITPYLPAGYTLYVDYFGRHPILSAFSDPVDERVNPDVMKWAALAHAYQWHGGGPGSPLQGREQQAWANLQSTLRDHVIDNGDIRVQGMPHWGEANTPSYKDPLHPRL